MPLVPAFRNLAAKARILFRPQDYELSDTARRSKIRYRRIAFGAGASASARLISVGISLFMVPLLLHYLGEERYGMWLTMTSLVSLLGLSDLGIGNGLVNSLAQADGKSDRDAAAQLVSSAAAALLIIAVGLGVAFLVAYPKVEWSNVLNIHTPTAIAEAGPAVAALSVCFIASLPLGVVTRVRVGLQEGYVDSSWAIVGTVLSLVAVLIAVTARLGLPWLAAAIGGVPLIAVAGNGASLFMREHPWLKLRLHFVTRRAIRSVLSVGVYFLILQTAAAVAYQCDTIIVAQVLGSAVVPQYAVPMKLFMTIPLLMSFVLIPVWPAYREAVTRGDNDWVRITFRRSLTMSLAFAVPVAVALTIFGQPVIHFWVGDEISATPLLMVGLGAWAIVAATGGVVSTLLNSLGVLRPQAILAVIMAVANVALSVALTHAIGVSGVVYGSLVAQAIFIGFPTGFLVRRELRRLSRTAPEAP